MAWANVCNQIGTAMYLYGVAHLAIKLIKLNRAMASAPMPANFRILRMPARASQLGNLNYQAEQFQLATGLQLYMYSV